MPKTQKCGQPKRGDAMVLPCFAWQLVQIISICAHWYPLAAIRAVGACLWGVPVGAADIPVVAVVLAELTCSRGSIDV